MLFHCYADDTQVQLVPADPRSPQVSVVNYLRDVNRWMPHTFFPTHQLKQNSQALVPHILWVTSQFVFTSYRPSISPRCFKFSQYTRFKGKTAQFCCISLTTGQHLEDKHMFIKLLLLHQVKPQTGAKIQTQTNLTIKRFNFFFLKRLRSNRWAMCRRAWLIWAATNWELLKQKNETEMRQI